MIEHFKVHFTPLPIFSLSGVYYCIDLKLIRNVAIQPRNMVLNLNGILNREFYLLGIARKVFPFGQNTIMII